MCFILWLYVYKTVWKYICWCITTSEKLNYSLQNSGNFVDIYMLPSLWCLLLCVQHSECYNGYEGSSIEISPGLVMYLLSSLSHNPHSECILLSHQVLNVFLKVFQNLPLEKLAKSLFHLSICLELASLESLCRWSLDIEVALLLPQL